MNAAQIQLSFEAQGLDPRVLARLSTPARGRLYRELNLDHAQIQAAEAEVRRVIRANFRRAA